MEYLAFGSKVDVGLWVDDLKLGLRTGLKWASHWKLDAVGLNGLGPEVAPNMLSESGCKSLKRKISSTGATLRALKVDVGGRRFANAKTLDQSIGLLQQACKLGRSLDARNLVVPLGFVPANDPNENQNAHRMVSEGLKVAINLTTNAGLRLVVCPGSEPSDDLATFLNQMDSSQFVGVDLNPGIFVSRGADPIQALNQFSPRVCIASALDFYLGGGEAPFGMGDVAWGELIVSLSSYAKKEPLTLLAGCNRECDRPQALAASIQGLKGTRLNPIK